MPLRRVTVSGRLATYESETPEPLFLVIIKGLLAMAFDSAVALGVAILAYKVFMGNLAPPHERGFYCHEMDSINHPFRPNTVSSKHLLAVTLALPFFIFFLIESVLFYHAKGTNRLRKCFYSTTSVYLEYLCLFTVIVLVMEGSKCVFARLRPHYLSVCKPDWKSINCTNPNTYISRLVKASKLDILRWLKIVILTVILIWTGLVLITRVTDYWHHPTDVLGGMVLGLLCAYIPFHSKRSESLYSRRLIEHPHLQ